MDPTVARVTDGVFTLCRLAPAGMCAMVFSPRELAALAIATSFAAGLNVSATVATLGLLAHWQLIDLPPALELLDDWRVIAAAGALFAVEFVADKVPFFDLLWNLLQTFVRVPIAALLAYGATSQLSPVEQLLSAAAGAAIALAAHGGKTAARVAVTPSPEPFSNIALSFSEDVLAVGLTWLATRHPYAAAATVLALLVLMGVLVKVIVRALRTVLATRGRPLSPASPG